MFCGFAVMGIVAIKIAFAAIEEYYYEQTTNTDLTVVVN